MVIAGKKTARIVLFLSAFLILFSISESRAAQGRVVRNDSTLTDTESGLVWPADADTPSFRSCAGGRKSWQEATDYVNCLNSNTYLGYRDWRLPAPEELIALANVPSKDNQKKVPWLKLREHGFKMDNPTFFWSSVAPTDEVALAVDMLAGGKIRTMGRLSPLRVWPVRGGR